MRNYPDHFVQSCRSKSKETPARPNLQIRSYKASLLKVLLFGSGNSHYIYLSLETDKLVANFVILSAILFTEQLNIFQCLMKQNTDIIVKFSIFVP